MTNCARFLSRSKARRDKQKQRVCERMARWRQAKERKRLENRVEREPELVRYYPLEIGVRDKRTGETAWIDFRSVRDAAKRLAVVQKFYR